MSQKLPANGFKWVKNLFKFNENFIQNYDENDNKGYFLVVDVDYLKKLHDLHKDLRFLPERGEIFDVQRYISFLLQRKKVKVVKRLVCDIIKDKEKYVIHIRALKQALNHGLILKRVQRVIQFNQRAWLKPYIDMKTNLRKEAKTEFEKDFFKLMNNSVFGKTTEIVRNYRDIKLETTDKRRKRLVSEPNYYASKIFLEHLMAIEMKKTKVKMNKPIFLARQY